MERLFSATEHGKAWSQRFRLSADGRLLFVSRPGLLERIGKGALVLAWTAAILAMIGGIWFAAL